MSGLLGSLVYELVSFVGLNILKTWLIVMAVISSCLLVRFLKIYYGRHTKPSPKKAILITGATSGFGLCMSNHFYKLGYSIIAAYYNDKEDGYKQLEDMSNEHKGEQRLLLVKLDVRSLESVRQASAQVDQWLDANNISLYCLVNNAGTSMDGPFEWCMPENLIAGAETNYVGVLLVTRIFMRRLIEAKGRVVNISSGLAHTPSPGIPVYGSTKAAVAYFTDALEHDVRHYGVKTYCVFPGHLIASTNIAYVRARSILKSIERLTPDELKLYSKSIHINKHHLRRTMREYVNCSKADPDEVAKIYDVDIKQFLDGSPDQDSLAHKLDRLGRYLIAGEVFKRDLSQTSVMEAFEHAVCLRSPPKRLYAGNRIFSMFVGPMADYTPWIQMRNIGNVLMRTQYNL